MHLRLAGYRGAFARDRSLGGGTDARGFARCDTWPVVAPTVLIVDDHPAFRSMARALLESEGFAVVGDAEDGASALVAVAALQPDVVLLDIQLPDLDGFEIAERLAESDEAPAVVLISTRSAAAYGRRLETTTARGFIPKTSLSGETLAALVS
jgi:two-component system nitrate/nitrite response regulator NarL